MKTIKPKEFYVDRAVKDFRTLVQYFCATRPRYQRRYQADGRFDLKKVLDALDFLDAWDRRPAEYKRIHARRYAAESSAFNYTFGMDSGLVKRVLGFYRDENGRKVRVSLDEVLDRLKGFVRVVNNGKKLQRNPDGTYSEKYRFKKKYLMANRQQWFAMMRDERYCDIKTYPGTMCSKRARDIIFETFGRPEAEGPVEEPAVEVEEKPVAQESPAKSVEQPLSGEEFVRALGKGTVELVNMAPAILEHVYGVPPEKIENLWVTLIDFPFKGKTSESDLVNRRLYAKAREIGLKGALMERIKDKALKSAEI